MDDFCVNSACARHVQRKYIFEFSILFYLAVRLTAAGVSFFAFEKKQLLLYSGKMSLLDVYGCNH